MTAIKKEIAKRMINEYQKRRTIIKDDNGSTKPDTDSVWLSKEYLLDFLNHRNPNSTGLRIYIGATGDYSDIKYPDPNNANQVTHVKKYMNQTNLIFVATESPIGQVPSMTNSTNMITSKKNLTDIDLVEENKAIILFGDEGMADDDHGMCPPPNGGCEEIM
ncbi:MAG: hypothetical protein ABIP95_07295 [Pelobium sp.]